MKTKTKCKKGGVITRSEKCSDHLNAHQVLEFAKRMGKRVIVYIKDTHTGESIKYEPNAS